MWWAGVDALLPKARIGKAALTQNAALIPALRAALGGLHIVAMEAESVRRTVPVPATTAMAVAGVAVAVLVKTTRRGGGTRAATVAAADAAALPISISAAALDRLYLRLRASFTASVRAALMGGDDPLVPWLGGKNRKIE